MYSCYVPAMLSVDTFHNGSGRAQPVVDPVLLDPALSCRLRLLCIELMLDISKDSAFYKGRQEGYGEDA